MSDEVSSAQTTKLNVRQSLCNLKGTRRTGGEFGQGQECGNRDDLHFAFESAVLGGDGWAGWCCYSSMLRVVGWT